MSVSGWADCEDFRVVSSAMEEYESHAQTRPDAQVRQHDTYIDRLNSKRPVLRLDPRGVNQSSSDTDTDLISPILPTKETRDPVTFWPSEQRNNQSINKQSR